SGSQPIDKGALVRVASDWGTTPEEQALRGKVVEYLGAAATIDLSDPSEADYTDATLWAVRTLFGQDLEETYDFVTGLIPDNLGKGKASASAGLVVRNDVRGLADARIDDTVLRVGGALTVSAFETATIRADNLSTVEAKGAAGSPNFNGVIAANPVLSGANPGVEDSDIVTRTGDVELEAQNISSSEATTTSSVKAKGVNVGITLAFNTVGYESQNLLFDLADTLFGLGIAD